MPSCAACASCVPSLRFCGSGTKSESRSTSFHSNPRSSSSPSIHTHIQPMVRDRVPARADLGERSGGSSENIGNSHMPSDVLHQIAIVLSDARPRRDGRALSRDASSPAESCSCIPVRNATHDACTGQIRHRGDLNEQTFAPSSINRLIHQPRFRLANKVRCGVPQRFGIFFGPAVHARKHAAHIAVDDRNTAC